jgi:hypothetical protein
MATLQCGLQWWPIGYLGPIDAADKWLLQVIGKKLVIRRQQYQRPLRNLKERPWLAGKPPPSQSRLNGTGPSPP